MVDSQNLLPWMVMSKTGGHCLKMRWRTFKEDVLGKSFYTGCVKCLEHAIRGSGGDWYDGGISELLDRYRKCRDMDRVQAGEIIIAGVMFCTDSVSQKVCSSAVPNLPLVGIHVLTGGTGWDMLVIFQMYIFHCSIPALSNIMLQ